MAEHIHGVKGQVQLEILHQLLSALQQGQHIMLLPNTIHVQLQIIWWY